jgi:hypothetical protein
MKPVEHSEQPVESHLSQLLGQAVQALPFGKYPFRQEVQIVAEQLRQFVSEHD